MDSDAGSPVNATSGAASETRAAGEPPPGEPSAGQTRIVLTRHPGQAGAMEPELRAAGFRVDFMPLTEQRLPRDTALLRSEISRLASGDYDWLVLTSANTVRALHRLGWSGEGAAHTAIAVTGPGTARVLQKYTGVDTAWIPSDRSAAGIVAELPGPAADAGADRLTGGSPANAGTGPGSRVLLPQSSAARSELAEGLTARGFTVNKVVAYDTVPLHRDTVPLHSGAEPGTEPPLNPEAPGPSAPVLTPAELRPADVVLVTSTTSASALLNELGRGFPCGVVAIGQPTARTLRELGAPADAVASDPSAAAVIAAVRSARLD
ncbi:MAG TPA: uroporphyrinogen-III synthase [Candidatus Nesterenkonia stercoripullorum]|uniref:Uroporphyrinogen-III synthase n=1 Tax=Candidatus Nesterenkonia stercoripullorum TaxID=2838701 RepID=A0A9D1UTK9_9MICC|nr:uroporphyrinogen-III synthase [Candidatus Nesterenkonia stercoripullorum]